MCIVYTCVLSVYMYYMFILSQGIFTEPMEQRGSERNKRQTKQERKGSGNTKGLPSPPTVQVS